MRLLLAFICCYSFAVEPHVYPISQIDEIYDGDTIKVHLDLGFDLTKYTYVRINGVNTPEVVGDEKIAGKLVRDEVIKWMASHQCYVKYVEPDKYGKRVVGDIIRDDDQRLSQFLLDSGYAKPYDGSTTKPTFTDVELQAIIGLIDK